jgi:hypothetical protein
MTPSSLFSQDEEIKVPTEIRGYRIYGGENELLPPVLLISHQDEVATNFGSKQLTFEVDIYANVPPSFYAEFVHCDINWNEDNNNFINNSGFMRTSDFFWETSPLSSSYYSHRGKLAFPNSQVNFKYSGNYKIKIYEYYKDNKPVLEGKFFVVQNISKMEMYFTSTFYKPEYQISNSAYNVEVRLKAPSNIFNANLKNVVLYRNFRWDEPYFISEDNYRGYRSDKYKYFFQTMISGFSSSEKRFYLMDLPAENMYRILSMENTAQFPSGSYEVRMPFADFIRNGNYFWEDDDGAMVTKYYSQSDDNYVYLEFILDPADIKANEDVFISGSFNNWNPDHRWIMNWDPDNRLYRLKQWVRRAKHNYLYGTGSYNIDTKKFDNISFDLYEGNTVYANHSIIALAYYRSMDYGGYDAIIGTLMESPIGTNWNR